jgi:malonate transporter and related proteins
MLTAFFNGVLPVFGVLAIGFAAGRLKVFDMAMAAAINRFVLLIGVPLLVFRLLARAPYHEFDWALLVAFFLSELMAYGAGFLLARTLFRCDLGESVLLGLASCFANHLLFVLAIATLLFGERATLPIVAIASVDAVTIYGGTLIIMEAIRSKDLSIARQLLQFVKNPAIAAIPIGLLVGLSGVVLPNGVDAFAAFVSLTASPCALFALGIVLSQQATAGSRVVALPMSVSAVKLLFQPCAAWLLIYFAFPVSAEWARVAMMVAAAPSAAMAFVFAVQYQVRVDAIARTVLITSIGSLLTVTLAASIR